MSLLACFGLRRRTVYDRPRLLDYLAASPLALIATILYRLFLYLRGSPLHPPRGQIPVRVVCISDTHDRSVHVPTGDVLVHAGDLSTNGTASDIQAQLDWIRTLPHAVKIVVAGNHDRFFDPESRIPEDVSANSRLDLDGLTYLEDELSVQEINVLIYIPSASSGPFESFAELTSRLDEPMTSFQYPPTTSPWFSRVPPQTDVLVTHTPPKHHLDLGLGCPGLLREIWRVRPRLHVFGHVHSAYGSEPVYFDEMQAAYERLLSRPSGPLSDLIPSRRWLDFLQFIFQGVRTVLWKWLMAGPGSNRGGLLVNAAQAFETTNMVKSRAIVVDI
ncbi:hypothetical protein CDD80_1198 [Ophiocordyceps camponoti-rufipedis]|uniref:Calcineurin-like phosphoesterase domain-containing protein n=1 Tax=Ophiocordyceps camponoti-rufipedis TaxID=2004952 RepID=A0A2C5ZAM2_9HYPO|nr:hypothetical protein CDD80_1198 [Ophiocordyceps camponoti-rufipedis]